MVGTVSLWVSIRTFPVMLSPELLLVIVAAAVTENFALRNADHSVSLAFPMVVAAMILAGPVGSGMAALASFTNLQDIRAGRPWSYSAYNAGQVLFSACAGGMVYGALGGPTSDALHTASPPIPHALAAVLVAATVMSVSNILLTATAAMLAIGSSRKGALRTLLQYLPTEVALTFVGFLVVQVIHISVWALPLFLFPLMLARQTYQRFATMREAYLDTVRSLVHALEAKDPYTRGHSERVARYAVAIAQQMNLDVKSIEVLEQAALLHDIGKLALPSAVLTKPASLTPSEFKEVKEHPARGAAIVTRIPPLRGLEESIRCHHERLDATGYPGGLAGEEIPRFARILAVADAYDAMTSNRAYRNAMDHDRALAELLIGSGLQFDAEVVRAFLASKASDQDEEPLALESAMIAAEVAQHA